MKPVIGISVVYENGGHHAYQRIIHTYVDAVERAGGLPLLIPCIPGTAITRDYIDAIDGLLLTGGADIAPIIYGENPVPTVGSICWERDEQELALFDEARKRGTPILGICRGLQISNVGSGGTLFQDIPSQVSGSFSHCFNDTEMDQISHYITLEKGSRMYEIFGEDKIMVNSFHHQSVKDVGKGLKVSARSDDGVIEAMQESEGSYVLLVQFHPEGLVEKFPKFVGLFSNFIKACQK